MILESYFTGNYVATFPWSKLSKYFVWQLDNLNTSYNNYKLNFQYVENIGGRKQWQIQLTELFGGETLENIHWFAKFASYQHFHCMVATYVASYYWVAKWLEL